MRTAFCRALYDLMAADPRVYALTADIGFRNFDDIIADFPDRFINVGIAEANMIGVAAGLALSGKRPFVFTIAPFVTLRCLEQIRIDLCYQNLPVTLVGAGGGFVYGAQGTTHHAIEEIGVLRCLPRMTVVSPADPVETRAAVMACMETVGPVYIRIGRNHEPNLYDPAAPAFAFGKGNVLREGSDVTLIGHGPLLTNVLCAAAALGRSGIESRVVDMHTVKPVDVELIRDCAQKTGRIVTIEEHNVIGGLGSAVAEVLAESNVGPIAFRRIGIADTYLNTHADYRILQRQCGLDDEAIAERVRRLLASEP